MEKILHHQLKYLRLPDFKCNNIRTSDLEFCSCNGFGIILSNIDTIVWQVQSQLALSNFDPLDVIKFSKQYVLD